MKLTGKPLPAIIEKMRKQGFVVTAEAAEIAGLKQPSLSHLCNKSPAPFKTKRVGKHWFVHIESLKQYRGI